MFKECLIAYNLCCKFFIGSGPEMYDTLEVEEFGSFLRNSRNLSLKIHVNTYLSIYLSTYIQNYLVKERLRLRYCHLKSLHWHMSLKRWYHNQTWFDPQNYTPIKCDPWVQRSSMDRIAGKWSSQGFWG